MQIARDLAGYTLPEADTLRKAIGKKIKSLLDEQKEKLLNGMAKNGIDKKIAQAIWELFPPFARYGFNKSHAACYAVIGYRTAYLKAHYLEEFMASLLNSELNDIERIAFFIQESKLAGLDVLPPDINKSFFNFAPEGEKLRFGLLAIKNVGSEIAKGIVDERLRGGPFSGFSDFLTRVQHKDLNKKSLESLIKAGSFESLGVERKQALENLDEITRFINSARRNPIQNGRSVSLFDSSMSSASLKMKPSKLATSEERLSWEKELLGFYLSDHPLNSYTQKIKEAKAKSISEVRLIKDSRMIVRTAGLISSIHRIFTKSGQPMLFAKIEDFSPKPIEVVVFNNTLTKTMQIWQENNVVLIDGRMSWRDGEPKIICEEARKMEA